MVKMSFRLCMLILIWANFNGISDASHCCASTNVVYDNLTCLDGSNVSVLQCELYKFMGPLHNLEFDFDIDDDGYLHIEENEDFGYLLIEPKKYCITNKFGSENKSVLVCYNKEEVQEPEERVKLTYAKIVCAGITLILLILTFIIYSCTPDLRDLEGICILNFLACLIISHTIATFWKLISLVSPDSCVVTSSIYLFGYFSAYNWLSVLSYHFWRKTVESLYLSRDRWIMLYHGYGYGIPILLALTALLFGGRNKSLRPGNDQCWYETGAYTVLSYFYGPVFITLLISIVLQLWAVKKVWIDIDSRIESRYLACLRKKSAILLHILLIFILIILTDIITFIFLHESEALDHLWDIIDCRNFLVGGVLFFILVVLRNKVLKALGKKEQILCISFPQSWRELVDEESNSFYRENITISHISKI